MWWDHTKNCSFHDWPEAPVFKTGCCFEGFHTTDPNEVDYNGWIQPCGESDECNLGASDDDE